MNSVAIGSLRVTFDVGGTFTDVIIANGDQITCRKILNGEQLGAVAEQIAAELELLLAEEHESVGVVHGTTIASNAVVEGTCAKTGFITTQGFRDELEIRRMGRPGIYDVMWQRPEAVIPRYLRFELDEAIRGTGAIERAIDEAALASILHAFSVEEVEAVGICLLNSHVNSSHEERLAQACREAGYPTSVSSEMDREAGEFERSSTTAVNASLLPVIHRYLDEVETPFRRLDVPFSLMQANGGITTPGIGRQMPVRLIESGPAAGVLGAAALCDVLKLPGAIAFDMGGTTVKACLIENGLAVERSQFEVGGGGNISARYSRGGGYLVRTPAFDLVELGAGGGSIVWLDDDQVMRVGPHSAAAVPGPAAYGRGGTEPTVTDANVILGHIADGPIGDGTVAVDRRLAVAAFTDLAVALGLTPEEAALGAIEVANASMIRAVRAVSTERGRNPADLTLIAFGGGGPIHAARLAERIGIQTILVPPIAGVFSAVGLQIAESRFDFAQGLASPLDLSRADALEEEFLRLESRMKADLIELTAHNGDSWTYERRVDVRYVEQATSLTAALSGSFDAMSIAQLKEAFEAEHEQLFGYRRSDVPIEVTAVRIRASLGGYGVPLELFKNASVKGIESDHPSSRSIYVSRSEGRIEAWSVPRESFMTASSQLTGPGVITDTDTTIVVPSGWNVAAEPLTGSIILSQTT